MTRRSVQDYVAALRPHYLAASRGQKRAILHEVCRVTGYHRKAVIRLLRGRRRRSGARRGRPATYGPAVAHALHQLWEASDYLCSRRLAPFLGELIDVLQRHHALNLAPQLRRALLTVSPSTIDRLLHPLRPKGLRRPHGGRPPTTAALRAQVPIRTFGEWRGVRPGSLQRISSSTAART